MGGGWYRNDYKIESPRVKIVDYRVVDHLDSVHSPL